MAHIINNLIVEENLRLGNLTSDVTVTETSQSAIALTGQSTTVQILTGSTSGQIVTLPDATGLDVGRAFFILNQSSQSVVVKDYSDTTIFTLPASQRIEITLKAKATSAGQWVYTVSSGLGAVSSVAGRSGDVTLASTDVTDFETAVRSAAIASSITDGDTTHAPSGDAVYDALATKLSGITVSEIDAESSLSNAVSSVHTIRFDKETGFQVADLGSGSVKVSLGSSFKTWEVSGQSSLVAVGEDTVEFIAGNNVTITTDPDSTPKSITISATGEQGDTGATGAAGADGRTILSGSSSPSSGTGEDGDFYINTATSDLYGPKTSGSWGSPTSLIGATGATGAQGSQGPKGDTGDAGPKGDTGDTVTDHGFLTGMSDDDHPQYLLASGERSLSGAIDMGTHGVKHASYITDGDDLSDVTAKFAVSDAGVALKKEQGGWDYSAILGSGGIIELTGDNGTFSNNVSLDSTGVEVNADSDTSGIYYSGLYKDRLYLQHYSDAGTPWTDFEISVTASGGTVVRSNHSGAVTGIDFSAQRIKNVATPTSSTDAASKGYVDGKVSDDAFGAGWDSATTTAPSKNAVYDVVSGKQATITGAATTITSSDLTASKALVSDGSGKVAASSVTSTELGYVSGVTSAIQTQINATPSLLGYNAVVGSGSSATHATIGAAVTAVSDGGVILVLAGTYAENVSLSKRLSIYGVGYSTQITGTLTLASGSSYSHIRGMRVSSTITVNSGVTGSFIHECWQATGQSITDNGTGTSLIVYQE